MQEHTSLPCTLKVTVSAGSDPKQKKLSFLPCNQKKCAGIDDMTPAQKELALPDTPTNMTRMNQEVDQNGSHEDLVERKNLALPGISTDNDRTNQSNEENTSAEQIGIPAETSQKHKEMDENASHEELIKILAIHGHLPKMVDQDGFRELVTWLNPLVKMPSHDDLMMNTLNLFQKEKSKLMREFTALHSRVCLSVYMWHYDPVLAFLCLRVHYIDDEWEKQQKVITFRAVDSSCNAKELSDIISGAVEHWGLDGKVFCIILDDAFIDNSVALSVKANLQERNPLSANQSLFVVRYATHLVDRVIQVGLDELEKTLEKLSKFSKCTNGRTPAAVQYPNCRYAPSSEDWWTAGKICDKMDDLREHVDSTERYPTPAHLFNLLWNVKKDVHFESYINQDDGTFSKIMEKMQKKFKESWKICFFHCCLPMIMDPECRLERFRSSSKSVLDCIHDVYDTLASLFNEYLDQAEDPNNTSGSKTSKGTVVDVDTLVEYYHHYQHQCSERPMTELDQYLQAPQLTTREPVGLKGAAGKPSGLQWWKEHSRNYPTVARMARDVLALPCISDWKAATRTATLAVSESSSKQWVEELVCTQDWLTPAGTTCDLDFLFLFPDFTLSCSCTDRSLSCLGGCEPGVNR
jgi:hypothetical protein